MTVTSDEPGAEEGEIVTLDLAGGYQFSVDFGDGSPVLIMDEPAPLGEGQGPNASKVLGAAVGNCLSASLLYCLRRARIEVVSMHTEVSVTKARNEQGRLRLGSVNVVLRPELAPGATAGRVQRCLELFEDFCVVTASVRGGVGVSVKVATDGLEGLGETSS